MLLCAARAAAAQRFQFSLGRGSRASSSSSGAGTVRDVMDDGRLHRGRCAGVGSFSYAHGKHHECASGVVFVIDESNSDINNTKVNRRVE